MPPSGIATPLRRWWSSPPTTTAGSRLLGVRAVIAESHERIHRSNLIGMGILPLKLTDGTSAASIGITGRETFAITGLAGGEARTPGEGRTLATSHANSIMAKDFARLNPSRLSVSMRDDPTASAG